MTTITIGTATGVLIEGVVHILKRSSSRYHLAFAGQKGQYCCQDGCCDRGLRSDVIAVVEGAKAHGATKVVIRTGQRGFYVRSIADLPVEDVSNHVGSVGGDAYVFRAW